MKIKAEVSEKNNLTHTSALFIKLLGDFFNYSNFPVALCTASAAAASFHISGSLINLSCLAFIFCATAFIYNIDRLKPSQSDYINSPERSEWIQRNSNILKNSTLLHLLLCIGFLTFQMHIKTFVLSTTLLGLCLTYRGRLQKLPAMKNIMVASVWTVTVSIVPAVWIGGPINLSFTVFCFLTALINTIIFDERDSKGDKLDGVKSIPLLLSNKTCSKLVWALCIFGIVFSVSFQPVLALIPLSYLSIYNWSDSRLKYTIADLVLALPIIMLFTN